MATTTTNTTPSTIEICSSSSGGGGSSSTTTTKVVQLSIGLPAAHALLESSGISAVKRHELLARQPSYCKILNDLKEVDPVDEDPPPESPPSPRPHLLKKSPPPELTMKDEVIELPEAGEVRQTQTLVINGQSYQIVTPSNLAGQATSVTSNAETIENVLSIANSGSDTGESQFSATSVFLPAQGSTTVHHQAEDQVRKREIRLLKNREAARECRNKKKEYIKCLENRVAVLENQNKALIEELKNLKEMYKSNN